MLFWQKIRLIGGGNLSEITLFNFSMKQEELREFYVKVPRLTIVCSRWYKKIPWENICSNEECNEFVGLFIDIS